MEEDTILEGFLCPICKADLKSSQQLTSHFENQHSEDQDLVKYFKGFFSNAKKKILSDDYPQRTWKSNVMQEGQELGQTRNYTEYFMAIRSGRLERYAAETNKLLIRLDKLLTNLPNDAAARKQHEKDIVPWLDGSSVNLCPGCARSFNITRRQHHCRLCGALQCDDCSFFLNLEIAMSMTNPSGSSVDRSEAPGLRLCEHCFHLLETRKHMQDTRNSKPAVTKLYDKLRDEMKKAKPDIELYLKMCISLREGDTTYNLADAATLRSHLATRASQLDKISKALQIIPCPEEHVQTQRLHKAIQQSAMIFLKSEILSLPSLPTEAQYKEIQAQRKAEAERRIEAERRSIERLRVNVVSTPTHSSGILGAPQPKQPVVGEGWTVVTAEQTPSLLDHSNDPLIEQMNNIKGFIKQARQALRFDEVATLEANLNELKQEFYNRSSTGSTNNFNSS